MTISSTTISRTTARAEAFSMFVYIVLCTYIDRAERETTLLATYTADDVAIRQSFRTASLEEETKADDNWAAMPRSCT